MFKKFLAIASIFLTLAALSPAAALADDYGLKKTIENVGGNLIPTKIAGGGTIPEIIGNVVGVGLGLVGIAFFLLALYAGLTWMRAMGNTEDVQKAKDILESAVIGLVLVLAAYAISTAVFTLIRTGSISGTGSAAEQSSSAPPSKAACQVACILQDCAICRDYSKADAPTKASCDACDTGATHDKIVACKNACQ